tara:strand:- start:14084 stop:14614 length:531 start_codon:yes stop_codon:yes gene_type:complete
MITNRSLKGCGNIRILRSLLARSLKNAIDVQPAQPRIRQQRGSVDWPKPREANTRKWPLCAEPAHRSHQRITRRNTTGQPPYVRQVTQRQVDRVVRFWCIQGSWKLRQQLRGEHIRLVIAMHKQHASRMQPSDPPRRRNGIKVRQSSGTIKPRLLVKFAQSNFQSVTRKIELTTDG